jgi:hypothetical protein
MMASHPTPNNPVESLLETGTFPKLYSRGSSSLTSRIENTKIEAEVYRSLSEFESHVAIVDARTTVDARAIVDRRWLIVRHWSIWLDAVRKRFAPNELSPCIESGLAGARTSAEALQFCLANGIAPELAMAIDSTRKNFSIVGSPIVNLVQDPEVDRTSYLVIEIQVRGTVRDNVMSHREFAREAAKLLGSKRGLIKLHYEIM